MVKATSRAGNPAEHCAKDTVLDSRTADGGQRTSAAQGCVPCCTAAESGSWKQSIPSGFTHSRNSHTTYPRSNRWGECPRCHQMFSGITAFDLHQTVDRNDEIAPDCLCWALTPGPGETSLHGAPHLRKWAVNGAKTLVLQEAEWGLYWSQDSDLSGVFG